MVLEDVIQGYVTLEGAGRDYGIVIDPGTMKIDEEGTRSMGRAWPRP